MPPATRRLVLGAIIGAALGAAILGREAFPLAFSIAGVAVGWGILSVWDRHRRWKSLATEQRRRWARLPGIAMEPDGTMHVHHGSQPLWIVLRSGGRLIIGTVVGEMPVAFRIWPTGFEAPPLSVRGDGLGEPSVDPVPAVEEAFEGAVQVACNDPGALVRLLDDHRNGPILAAAESPTGSFAGVTYDGRHLSVHLQGPLASDPERATQLARLIWEPWV